MNTEYQIKVMQAFLDGHEIQWRGAARDDLPYNDVITPGWNWTHFYYRVKPKKTTLRVYRTGHGNYYALPFESLESIEDKFVGTLEVEE